MKKFKLTVASSLLIFLSFSQAQAVQFKAESSVLFKVKDSNMEKGDASYAFQFSTLNQLEPYKNILASDYLSQRQEALASQQGPAGSALKIRKIMITKTAFRLNKSIDEVKALRLDRISAMQNALHFEFDSTCLNLCKISQKVRYFLFSTMVDMNLEVQLYSLTNPSPETQSLLTGLEVPNAALELRLLGRNWSHIFTLSQSVTYFMPRDNKSTDVVVYQIMSIKDESYSKIPNLEGAIQSILKNQAEKMIEFLRMPNSPSRNPASSDYDKDLYRQQSYQLDDPAGDEALIVRSGKIPKNILKALIKAQGKPVEFNDWTPEQFEMIETSSLPFYPPVDPKNLSIQGRNNPIKVFELSQALGQVIKEENLTFKVEPQLGHIHKWSRQLPLKFKMATVSMTLDKVFVALCLGFTDRFMKTDQEWPLRKWVLEQPYNSISLPEMFRKSYQLNFGDVYLTLLTIENLLASNWRYPGRESLPITKRLIPIANGYNYDSDRYGTWYHLFGMMLYGYVKDGFHANFIGHVEALGSNVLSRHSVDKTQKQWMNKEGGFVGQSLKKMVLNQTWKQIEINPENLTEAFYLDKTEDYRDRLSYPLSQKIKVETWGQMGKLETIHLKNLDANLEQCRIDVIYDNGFGFDSRNISTFYEQSLITNQELILVTLKNPVQHVRVFVYDCKNLLQEQFVMEAAL